MNPILTETIVAQSTPSGSGALAVIRMSGESAISIADSIFSKSLADAPGYSLHFGSIISDEGRHFDDVVVSVYRSPKSYTREDSVEISCHGSPYIIEAIIQICLENGAVLAQPGEFTQRAYLNGQLDLAQAEAVADLIASTNKAQHELALNQLKGKFSENINSLRDQLIHFSSLIELENDFGEEDVEFADRTELESLVNNTIQYIKKLRDSFQYGSAIKKGIPVVIVGEPNVGKSTLLNALLEEDKAIVSDIAGTTRDYIEDYVNIEGIDFRFIDTAGLRETDDEIESIGIRKTREQMERARVVLVMIEYQRDHEDIVQQFLDLKVPSGKKVIILLNKSDVERTCSLYDVEEAVSTSLGRLLTIAISAKHGLNLDKLKESLASIVRNQSSQYDVVLSNKRHEQALMHAQKSLEQALVGLQEKVPSDLVAIDIKHASLAIGEITGQITTDDLLDKIFRDFCIGK